MTNMVAVGGRYKGLGDILSDNALYDMESYGSYLAGQYANVSQTLIPTIANYGLSPPSADSLAKKPSGFTINKNLIFGVVIIGALLAMEGKRR